MNIENNRVRVLIVEDSNVCQELLTQVIEKDSSLRVIGKVSSAEDALTWLKSNRPDVISIDINLPGMDGFQLTEKIMEEDPLPIVIISSQSPKQDAHKSFQAIEAGAVCILEKPRSPLEPEFAKKAEYIRSCLRSASKTKNKINSEAVHSSGSVLQKCSLTSKITCVAIGGSLGGPNALRVIFSKLPKNFPVPIFVVQHISPGFSKGMAEWLQLETELTITLAKDKERAKAGGIYLAPDRNHMLVKKDNTIHLDPRCGEREIQPSVSKLFQSVADSHGANSMGVILTGMGSDGAKELLLIKEKGGKTIAQDKSSCVIFGMPSEAIRLGAASFIVPLDEIAGQIIKLL